MKSPEVGTFRGLFAPVTDAYGIMAPSGPIAVREPLTDDLLTDHLEGRVRVGAYFLDAENYATAICLDDDEGRPDLVRRIVAEFKHLGFAPLVESSKSRGFHVWVFADRVPAGVLRTIGLYVANRAGVPELEVFPKQEKRPDGGLGNYVWLPLFGADLPKGKTAFLDHENGLTPFTDQKGVLASVCRASLETVASAQATAEKAIGTAEARRKDPIHDAIPVGKRRDTLTRIAGANRRMGLEEAEIYPVLAEVNRTRCNPMLPDEDVKQIAKSITRYKPGETLTGINQPSFAEAANPPSLEFPQEVMTGLARDFADLYSTYLEPPRHMFFMAFLTCLGAAIPGRLTLVTELEPQPRMYTLLLGESGDDRKSTAVNKTVRFFQDAVFGFSVCHGVGSAEGLQKRMEKENTLLLCFDEFKIFISKSKIEASVLLPCVNSLFELNHYESRTKTSEICLENVFLSILAASTVDTYENCWSNQFTDIGFNNRLWLVPGGAKRTKSLPDEIPKNERESLTLRVGELLQHINVNSRLVLTPEAKAIYHDWYMNTERSIHSKRLDTYALKLMALLAANDLKREVDEDVVRRVIALCNHQYQVRQLYDPIDADNAVAKMEIRIRRVLGARGSLTERDIKRHVHAERAGSYIYNTAKANLWNSKEIGRDKGTNKYFIRKDR